MPVNERLTAERLFEKWSPLILKIGLQYGQRSTDVEDFRDMIVMEFIEGKYEEIYDPTRSSEYTFVFAFCRLRALRELSKRKRDPLAGSSDIEEWDSPGAGRFVDMDLVEGVNRLKARLANIPPRSVSKATGVIRSLTTLVGLLEKGFTQRESARHMDYSEGSVSMLTAELRRVAEEQGLRALVHGS